MSSNREDALQCRVNTNVFFVSHGSSSSLSTKSEKEKARALAPMTLRRVAYEVASVPLEELRALNPEEPLASMPSDTVLEVGTKVQLPVTLHVYGSPYGLPMRLGTAEAQLQDCEALLDSLVMAWEGRYGAQSLDCLPPRKACSQTEAMMAKVHEEVVRQLPSVAAKLERLGNRDTRLPLLVDVTAVKAAEPQIAEAFRGAVAVLESFKAENEAATRAGSTRVEANAITQSTLHTKRDTADDFCVAHTHRWEFAVHPQLSREPDEVWAVLSCQPLVALVDAIRCLSASDPLTTGRNAFLFIHGVFYIDDRHKDEADFVDLSEAIRTLDPLQDPSTFLPLEHQSYGRCPVRSAATTTFKDINIKMGELCALRHCGGCEHYFYLSHVRSLRGYPRTERHDFPHRVAKTRESVHRCHLCHLFPATVALYEDPLSPASPAFYCPVCDDLLHGRDTPDEAALYQRREAKDLGELYFRNP